MSVSHLMKEHKYMKAFKAYGKSQSMYFVTNTVQASLSTVGRRTCNLSITVTPVLKKNTCTTTKNEVVQLS